MRRLWLYLVGAVLIGGAGVAVFLAADNVKDNKSKSTGPSNLSTTANSKKACSIFTLAEAKQLLGDTAKGGANRPENESGDLTVSSCIYSQSGGSNAPVTANKSASLLVRSPKTPDGVQSNINQFDVVKPASVQDVTDYGDKAYWDPDHGQLDILKNSNWYILSYGSPTPSTRTLDETKQLADLLINRL